jgi:hypothetical protein
MPLPLPNLDDLTWDDLLEGARARITAYAPEWTDFNASDPGITLLELFAYHVEALIYRLNRVGAAHRQEFLRLANGAHWKPGGNQERDLESTLRNLRRPIRAVTVEDYERFAMETAAGAIARVRCVSGRNLERGRFNSIAAEAPGDVSLIVMTPGRGGPDEALLANLRAAVDPVRLLGTRVHIVGPRFLTVGLRFTLVIMRNASAGAVLAKVKERIAEFFDPLPSATGSGWPFGRAVHISEIYGVLDRIPGVSYVAKTMDPSTGIDWDEAFVTEGNVRRLRRNPDGDLDAVYLYPDELVAVDVDGSSFRIVVERAT